MELLGNNPSMQDLIEKLNEVVGSLNNSLPNTDSELAEVKKLVSFGSNVLAGRLNAKLWYFKTQELMKASTELCEGDSCFILNPGSNTGEGTFEYWYIYKTADVGEILDSYIELANPDLVGVKIQELTFKALLSKLDSIKKFSFLDLVTTATETNPGKALDAIVGKLLADRIGNLGELSTVDKNSLVGAIKEVKTVVEDNYSENTKKIDSKAERTELQTETSERKQEIAVERARINNLLKSTSDTVTSTCEVSDEYGGNASAEVSSDGINVQIKLTNFQFLKTWESSDGTEATASPEKILDLPNHSFAPFEERTVVHIDGTLSYYIENDSLYVTSSTATISIFSDVTISYTIIDSLQSEVADIRVGANGKVYDTAGEAVRGQVSELKGDLDKNFIRKKCGKNILDVSGVYSDITEGYYIQYTNGFKEPVTGMNYALIPVNEGESYSVNVDNIHIGFFKSTNITDRSNTWVSGFLVNATNGYTFTVPTGAKYMTVSYGNSKKDTIQVELGTTVTEYDSFEYGLDSSDIKRKSIKVKNLNNDVFDSLATKKIVHIGDGYEYTSILEALTSNDENIRFIVHAGTYDIVSEYKSKYGDSYFDDYNGYSGATFDAGLLIKDGCEIITVGTVILEFNYTGDNAKVKQYFSPINTTQNNVIDAIDIAITDDSCRYHIHDDFASKGGTNVFRNICMFGNSHLYTGIGGGMGKANTYIIENCYIDSGDNENGISIAYHNNVGSGAKNKLIVKDCYCNRMIRGGMYGASTDMSYMFVSGCKASSISCVLTDDTGTFNNENIKLVAWNNITN